MDAVVDAIRAALTDGATPEARAAGVAACRSVLAALEPVATTTAPAIDASGIANVVAALRGAQPDQLLDLAIAKLRSMVPPSVDASPVQPLKFQILPVPKRRG